MKEIDKKDESHRKDVFTEEVINRASEIGCVVLEDAIEGSLIVKGFKTFKDASDFANDINGVTRYFKFVPSTGITEIENHSGDLCRGIECTRAYPKESYLDKFNSVYLNGYKPYTFKKKFSEAKFVKKMLFELTSGWGDFNLMLSKLEGLILKYKKLYEEDKFLKGGRVVLWNDKYSHSVPCEIMEFHEPYIMECFNMKERIEAFHFVGVQILIL